ncbi:MAG TPA: sulfatase [Candidatus Acidoferrum sp.]|nr:sulfatase [Candidatus Acidoferrum sp.]
MSPITRRKFLGQVAGTAAAVSLPNLVLSQSAPASCRKFNVLFLMSDDMRVELGCYGSMFHALTPNLDALAKSGVRFDRNYCQFPLCNPSRASLLTGRPPTRTRVLGNRTDFRVAHPDWITLPQWFKENGYVSVRAGKIFHGGIDDAKSWGETSDSGGPTDDGSGPPVGKTKPIPRVQIPQPDGVLPPLPADNQRATYSDRIVILDGNGEGHGDYRTADRTIENLRRFKDRPFFIACGFVKPHSPPTAPQRFFDLYDPKQIRLTPDFAAWPTVPPGFPSAAIRKRNADLFIGRGASEDEAREVIRAYLASISWVDWNLGRVVSELDRLGLRDNTIIVFAADHGYQLGEKGKWSKAGSLFEMGTRVPMIMAVPGVKGNGQSCFRIVQSLDIYPTLVELCGLPQPAGLEGHSLVPLLNDPQAAWDRPAYSVWSEDGSTLHGVAVRTEKWRYAEYGPEGKNGAMLLDAHGDPFEMKNLADDPRQSKVCAELAALTRQYAATLGKPT